MSSEPQRKEGTGAATPEPTAPASPVEALGDQLRDMFDHVAEQPIPDPIARLVEKLEVERLGKRSDRRS